MSIFREPLNEFRRLMRRLPRNIWAVVVLAVLALIIVAGLTRPAESAVSQEVAQVTLDAAAARANLSAQALASELTLTPAALHLTNAAPTLALLGQQEIRQYAASARADSEVNALDWGAVQAAGPPNTPGCGNYRSAWATANPNGSGTLTLYYAQLVRPTAVVVYHSFNPGFIRQITLTDVYGDQVVIYAAIPQAIAQCPFAQVFPVADAKYGTNTVTLTLDQIASIGGANQIDAVELVGVKY